jgi:hypothetical protein
MTQGVTCIAGEGGRAKNRPDAAAINSWPFNSLYGSLYRPSEKFMQI